MVPAIRIRRITFLCIFSLSVFMGGTAYGIATDGPHAFSPDECTSCHVSVPAGGQGGPFQMTAPVAALCRKCHKSGMKSFSHPVGFKPKDVKIPSGFPLSYDGEFTCSTCHDIHADIVGPTGLRSYYLRHKTGEGNFCTECHDRRKISHEVLLSAHMKKNSVAPRGLMIDELSNQCLSCHNGVTAKNVLIGLPLCSCPEEQTSHPIGMDYEKARIRTGRLKTLDKTIKLFNGKVGCGSCHDPYSKNPKMLVVPNTGSALCLKCHIE